MKTRGSLVVVSGFSGVGKGTIMKRLLSRHEGYALSISATTRARRANEREGVDYYFLEQAEFEKRIREGYFLEYALYVDHYYGSPAGFVEEMREQGKDVLLEIEVQGALKIKASFPDALLVYLTPPSAAELERRLRGRGTESEEAIRHRLEKAISESEGAEEYDYILVNDDIDSCTEKLHNLICASHDRAFRHMELVRRIRKELGEKRRMEDAASNVQ